MKTKSDNTTVSKGRVTMVRRAFDTPLTAAEKREARALAAMPDSEIDYSDIPPLTDEFWKNAARNPFYRPVKKQLTVRVDSDILAWLKQKGAGYQTRINALLREAMLAERTDTAK
jgi:uncharacterized protein (DUF4415 family)